MVIEREVEGVKKVKEDEPIPCNQEGLDKIKKLLSDEIDRHMKNATYVKIPHTDEVPIFIQNAFRRGFLRALFLQKYRN